MTSIIRATEHDSLFLSQVAKKTFIESHGSSAPQEDIDSYISEKYTEEGLRSELKDPANIYHLLYYNGELVGFSRIFINVPYNEGADKNIAKLDRIFLLEKVYGLNLGKELLGFNIDFMKQQHQTGAWLYVWVENERAIHFYKRNGFVVVGSHDFKISENHTNPNHQMFLEFPKG